MKGTYALIIKLRSELDVKVGSLGIQNFEKGDWVYIGSAMGNGSTSIENRLRRHFRSQKAIHWHIDYLLNSDATLEAAIWARSDKTVECELAQQLTHYKFFRQGPYRFGASDCRKGCRTHLFIYTGSEPIVGVIRNAMEEISLNPRMLKEEDIISDNSETWIA